MNVELTDDIKIWDRKELKQIYDEHYINIVGLISYKIQSVSDAEDIAHDVFLRLVKVKFKKNKIIGNINSWLRQAAIYEIKNYYSKNKIHEDIDYHHNDRSLQFINGERDKRIIFQSTIEDRNTFDNDMQLVVYDMIEKYGYSERHVARELGITRHAVSMHLKEAKQKIMEKLNSIGINQKEESK